MSLRIRRARPGTLAAAAALAVTAALGAAVPAAAESTDVPGAAAPPIPLRVTTYNIHAGAGEDNVFDLHRTAEALRLLDADVIGLQEVDLHWGARSDFVDEAGVLAELLGMRVFFAPIYDLEPATEGAARRQYGVAVLSRYPILDATNHEITRLSTQTPNPVPAPAPGFAEVTVNVQGAHVHVYSTHLDYRSDPSVRRAQVSDMLGILAADSGPKVLVGDFNAEPAAPEARRAVAATSGRRPGRRRDLPRGQPDQADRSRDGLARCHRARGARCHDRGVRPPTGRRRPAGAPARSRSLTIAASRLAGARQPCRRSSAE